MVTTSFPSLADPTHPCTTNHQLGAGHRDATTLVSQALLKHPDIASITPPGFDGPLFLPPLTLAAAAGNDDLVSLLLGAGAAPNPRTSGPPQLGWTPLFLACREGHANAAALLMDMGGVRPEDCVATGGVTPLMAAAEGGHADVVELLVSRLSAPGKGAAMDAVDARDARGLTALHMAVLNYHAPVPVIKALVRKGRADPWAPVQTGPGAQAGQERQWQAYEGYTSFQLAIATGALRAANVLVQTVGSAVLTGGPALLGGVGGGSDGGGNMQPLHIAIRHGRQESLEWLLQRLQAAKMVVVVAALAGRDDWVGSTPLIAAVKSRSIPMVEALLKAGTAAVSSTDSIGEQDWNGWDALHHATALAVEEEEEEGNGAGSAAAIVRLLLMAGASPLQRIGERLPDSSPLCPSRDDSHDKREEASVPRRLSHEGWTAQALALAAGRLDLFALLTEGSALADVALDAWVALAATAATDERLRLGAIDYVLRGAVEQASVVRVLLRDASASRIAPLGYASTFFPDEQGLEPGALVTPWDVACYLGQIDAAVALRPPFADPRVSPLHQHSRQPPRWSRRQVLPLSMAVRGGHPELVRLLLGWMDGGGHTHGLACGLQELAGAALEAASTAMADTGGSCIARRRLARRADVLRVLKEALPCEEEREGRQQQQQEEEEQHEDSHSLCQETVEETRADQEARADTDEGAGLEHAEDEALLHVEVLGRVRECLDDFSRPPPATATPALVLLAVVFVVACMVYAMVQRRRVAGAAPKAAGAAAESTQAGAVLQQSSPPLVGSEEAKLASALPSEERTPPPSSPETTCSPPATAASDHSPLQEEEVEEEDNDDDDGAEETRVDRRFAAFTMGALRKGSCRLPPETSRRLLAEMLASPSPAALRKPWSPLSPAGPGDESKPTVAASLESSFGAEAQGAGEKGKEEKAREENTDTQETVAQGLQEEVEADKKEEDDEDEPEPESLGEKQS